MDVPLWNPDLPEAGNREAALAGMKADVEVIDCQFQSLGECDRFQ